MGEPEEAEALHCIPGWNTSPGSSSQMQEDDHLLAPDEIEDLIRQVKLNSNISDAKFWGSYSICGLLMRYRELYRNEHALMPWDVIDHKEVSSWIHERETLWKKLEDLELQKIVIRGGVYDPFDVNSLNARLRAAGLIYGSGYGMFNKPTFFIARLEAVRDLFDYPVHYAGSELCRDIASTPAMLQGRCIYVRREIILSFIWDRFQELKANRFGFLTEMMFSHYGIGRPDEACPELFAKIRRLAADVAELFIMHEAGEAYEDEYSGEWHEMLGEGCGKATELFLRAIKDIRADTSPLGPLRAVTGAKNLPLLGCFVALMDGIRREIAPEIREAFQVFSHSMDWSGIERARLAVYQRSSRLQSEVVRIWSESRQQSAIAEYVRIMSAGMRQGE